MQSLEDEDQFIVLLDDHPSKELWRACGPHNQNSQARLFEVLKRLFLSDER
jgi:hypothetical protein